MKKSQVYLSIIILVCCLAGWFIYLDIPRVQQNQGVTYYLRSGTSNKIFVADMQKIGIIGNSLLLTFYILPQKSAQLKTGEYLFPKGSNLFSIWYQVTNGKGLMYRPFTIVPGWSFAQLREELLKVSGLHHASAKLTDNQIMQLLGSSALPEGEFFPDTYYYTKDIPDLVILKRAYHSMQLKLKDAWQHKEPDLPYENEYEALIAASIIEKEAYVSTERPLIAGVMVNRLKKDMLLQVDPTVIYGLGSRYDGKIHKSNLLENTPYNTYLHKGLPPTPIAMPSMSAINAALHPAENDYLYFVAKGDGSHQFSKSLVEHQAAVAESSAQRQHEFKENLVQQYLQHHLIKNFQKFSHQRFPQRINNAQR